MQHELHSGRRKLPGDIRERSTRNSGTPLGVNTSSLEGLSDYLRAAWERNRAYEPPRNGQPYRSPMWEFVRSAAAHQDLRVLDALAAAAAVEHCLEEWEGAGSDLWKAWFPKSDDPKSEFVCTWDSIKWPEAVLDQAVAFAAALPLKPTQSMSEQYGKFIGIVGHLQRLVEGPILVPCVKFSALLECEPNTISRYRKFAQSRGLLKLVRKGIKAQRKADEFAFAVELFDWKTGNQISSENLILCLPSSPQMLNRETEIQEIERKKEVQEKQETNPT